MSHPIAASELVLTPDGRVYHCNLLPEDIADTIFLVGDPDRVAKVSKHFDTLEFKTQKREIITHTGIKNGKRVSVISTGMGTDNIDIVLSELDAVANIDLKNRTLNEQHRQLTFIRIGTSGALQADIPVDSFLASTHGLGFDGLLYYYQGGAQFSEHPLIKQFVTEAHWNPLLPKPYLVAGDADLIAKAQQLGYLTGVTATATGFFGPQGRVLRLGIQATDLNEKLSKFRYENLKITNFEMETSAIYGLSALMGHRALAINCIIANRFTKQFSKDYQKSMAQMIEEVLAAYV